jgi:hypothetical protein
LHRQSQTHPTSCPSLRQPYSEFDAILASIFCHRLHRLHIDYNLFNITSPKGLIGAKPFLQMKVHSYSVTGDGSGGAAVKPVLK